MKRAKKYAAARIVSILLVVLLAVSALASPALAGQPTAASVLAAGFVVTVGAPAGGCAAGDAVAVPVTIAGNPGFEAATLKLIYDTGVLELTGYTTAGTLFGAGSVIDNHANGVIGFFGAGRDIKENGTLFIANFTVKAGARDGRYPISIGAYRNLPGNFVNWHMEPVSPSFAAGSILVVNASADANSPAPGASGDTGTGGASAADANSPASGTSGGRGAGTGSGASTAQAESGMDTSTSGSGAEKAAESETDAQGQAGTGAASRIDDEDTALAPGRAALDPAGRSDDIGGWTPTRIAGWVFAVVAAVAAGFFAIRFLLKRKERNQTGG